MLTLTFISGIYFTIQIRFKKVTKLLSVNSVENRKIVSLFLFVSLFYRKYGGLLCLFSDN